MKLMDLTGQRFGSLVVLGKGPRGSGTRFWVRCDCGAELLQFSHNIRQRQRAGCSVCRKVSKQAATAEYRQKVQARLERIETEICGTYFNTIGRKRKPGQKQVIVDISYDFIVELFAQQGGKCALTGQILLPPTRPNMRTGNCTASLDRIDPTLGYIAGNVQWVHKDVNRMKNIFPQEYYIYMCAKIAANAGMLEHAA